ncbi:MAG: TonB-dependent receptor [Pseudomonadota bacterium]
MKISHFGRRVSYSSAFSLCLFSGAPAVAELEEIIVTAQFRTQNLQEVPVAVRAFSATEIVDAGISSSQDFVDLTPNLALDDSFTYGNTFISIRGVSQINNADSPVAIIVDGVPQNNQKQFKMQLFDIERIEVLRGPQGSLYGRNAIGGAINIVSKKPTNELEGSVGATFGNGGLQEYTGAISGPILADTLAFRLAGSYLERDGLIDNTFLGTEADFVDEDYAVRGALMFTPSESLSIDLRLATAEFEAGSSYDVITDAQFNPTYRSGDANSFFDPDENFLGVTEGEFDEATLKVDWDMDFATLTLITGYTDLSENYQADLDFSNPEGLGGFQGVFGEVRQSQDLDVELLSQEIRLTSNESSNLTWVAGAFYIQTDRELQTLAGCDDDPACAAFLEVAFGLDFTPDDDFVFINRREDNDNTAWALFGQAEYSVSDKLTFQFGLRYDEDDREQTDLNAGGKSTATYDAWQPKLGLVYDFSEDMMGYATYSTGFRSGGFNAPGLQLPEFEDEFLQNYEAGLKSELLEGRLVLNTAVFWSQSDDYQFFFVDAASAAQFIGNLEEVEILGLDADFRFLASDAFEIYGGVGLADTEINEVGRVTSDALIASGVDITRVEGSRAPKNTPVTFNLGGQFTANVSSQISLIARVDYEHRGKRYWQVDNIDVQDELNLVNARLGLNGESWAVTVWGRNLTDEEYYTDFNPAEFSGSLTDIGFPAQPRTYGVDLSYVF